MLRCPPVPSKLPILPLELLGKGTRLFRVGIKAFPANAWDARPHADYRFSPLPAPRRRILPVTYCGATADVALLETVLRFDVPGGVLQSNTLTGKFLAEIETTRNLALIPLTGPAARKLGEGVAIHVAQCPAADYGLTREWAIALRHTHPEADGITWISRQHGESRALVIWRRGREKNAPLKVKDQVDLGDQRALSQIARLADMVGIRLI